jgi:tetratricopeptide (TPR) repeat protein
MKYYFLFLVFVVLYSCHHNTVFKQSVPNITSGLNDSVLIDSLSQLINQNQQNAALYGQRAYLQFKTGNLPDALADYLIANRLDSLNAQYYCHLSDIYLQLGKSEITRDLLFKANRLIPKNVEVLYRLGCLYFYVQDYKKAGQFLDEAVAVDPYFAPTYFTRGLLFKEKGDSDKAIENLQFAVERQPEYFDAYMQLGLLYAAKSDSLALAYYRNAININPQSYEAFYGIAMFYQDNGNPEKALEIYRQMIKQITHPLSGIYYNMGYVEMEYFADYQRAIERYDSAIILKPDYKEAFCNRAFCYYQLHKTEKARADYQQAIIIDSAYQPALEGLKMLK